MTTEELSVITTGSTEIDRRLGGGIPYNTVMLIEGQDASGTSTFAQLLLWGPLGLKLGQTYTFRAIYSSVTMLY